MGDYYYNHTCFMKLGGAVETEDNNQAWLSPMKYPMSSGWRNTKTKVEFVLPASKAIMFLYFRLGQIGHTDDSAYGYACRYHYGTFEIVSVAGTIKRTVASDDELAHGPQEVPRRGDGRERQALLLPLRRR